MALFRNLGVNLRDRLCDVPWYASAQSLDFLDLAKNCSFLNWKLTPVPINPFALCGWALAKAFCLPGQEHTGIGKKVLSLFPFVVFFGQQALGFEFFALFSPPTAAVYFLSPFDLLMTCQMSLFVFLLKRNFV
jgi:hypothetical protein